MLHLHNSLPVSKLFNTQNSYNASKNSIPISNKISFSGKLENDFFEHVKNGEEDKAQKDLNKINFDITEKDKETGNNVFHFILQDNSEVLWEKLNGLLNTVVAKFNPEKIFSALEAKNNQNKTPFDCAVDNTFLEKVKKDISKISPIFLNPDEQPNTISNPQNPKVQETAPESVSNPIENKPLPQKETKAEETKEVVGNELQDDIDIGGNDDLFGDFTEENIKEKIPFENVASQDEAKNVLLEYIVEPLQKNKPVLVNGILLYGTGNNGKSYIVEELFKELGKEKVSARKVVGQLDNTVKETLSREKLLDKYAIQISADDSRYIDDLLEHISNNYKKTGKQTILYIDEIAQFFLSDQGFTKAGYGQRTDSDIMRKFDNSTLKGCILIGTTNDLDLIQSDMLRSNRFQKKVEIKYPNGKERDEFIKKSLGENLNIQQTDFTKIVKKTAGFSFGDLESITRLLKATGKDIDFNKLNNAVGKYAEENRMGQLSDEGTTSNYDTFIQRTPVNYNFSEVAGMKEAKEMFRSTVIDRLKPEIIQRFKENKRPVISSNFLLYGPPGTGKTYIVEALSGESHIPLYKVDASTFESKYVGESEQNLKRIFAQLEKKFKETGEYSILFIDEANKILGRRDSTTNPNDSTYVEQLLQYIDNSFERGIITITATNYKEKMDDAVLSRLGKQMMIGYPDYETIKALIKNITKNIIKCKSLTDEDIASIAKCIRGFGSREIKQMITQIVDDNIQGENKELTLEDFKEGISRYAQSHELPAINERNRTSAYDKFIKRLEIRPTDPQSLDDIGGMKEVKEKLLNAVMGSSLKPEIKKRYEANRVKGQNGILLYGAPGCGKTYIMKALAAHLDLPIYEFKLSQFGSKYIHETAENIGKIFDQLKEKYRKTGERSILMLDEFEDIAGRRDERTSEHTREETNTLLKEISDAEKNGIIVVAATNYYDQIDDAMKRPGRFVAIEVTPPDFEAKVDIIKKTFSGREIADKLFENEENFVTIAKEADNFAIVDITETINRLIKDAIDNDVEKLSVDDVRKAFIQRREDKEKEAKLNNKSRI